MEFRSGLSVNGWGHREFLEVDKAGELLEDSCREPKVMEWKVEQVWGDERKVAWCFRPRWVTVWIANIKFADGVRCYEVKSIEWLPAWGRDRIAGMLKSRPDWCLSRQRLWGVPIPVFYCEGCDGPLVEPELMRKVATRFEAEGADAWFEYTVQDSVVLEEGIVKNGGRHLEQGFGGPK